MSADVASLSHIKAGLTTAQDYSIGVTMTSVHDYSTGVTTA